MKKTVKERMKDCVKADDSGSFSALYGLGFIGAAIYYISVAPGLWPGVLGFLKAIVWPVFLIYKAFVELAA